MATCIHSSRSCPPPFYTIPIFPLLNRKIFHLLVHVYSLAGKVKRSQSSIFLDIRITVSFGHQISDYIEKSIPRVKSTSYRVKQTYLWSNSFQGVVLFLNKLCIIYINNVHVHVHVRMLSSIIIMLHLEHCTCV